MLVLDHGEITLEAMYGGDAVVARAARICYQSEERATPEADERLIRTLLRAEPAHNTVFEHCIFRWLVRAPIFVTRQWMRHRIGTFNEKSLRYCEAAPKYYIPSPQRLTEDTDTVAYGALLALQYELYRRLVQEDGWPPEVARGLLGTAYYTEFIWTVNAWSLMNWMRKRLDSHAQWEHRQYAEAALIYAKQHMPIVFTEFEKLLKGEEQPCAGHS